MEILEESRPESSGQCEGCKLWEHEHQLVTLQKCGHQFCLGCFKKHMISGTAISSGPQTSNSCTISLLRGSMCPICPWSPLALDDIFRITRAFGRATNRDAGNGRDGRMDPPLPPVDSAHPLAHQSLRPRWRSLA